MYNLYEHVPEGKQLCLGEYETLQACQRATEIRWDIIVRRHIVGGANRTLISAETPLRSCRIGTCRRLSAG